MSSNLSRWAKASLALYTKDNLSDIEVLLAGMHWNVIEKGLATAGKIKRVELRLEGPTTRQRSNLRQRHTFTINYLVTTSLDSQNIYVQDELVDRVRGLFKDAICLYQIEKGDTAPFVKFGALRAEKSLRRQIYVYNHGQREPNLNIVQTTIAARYYVDEVYR